MKTASDGAFDGVASKGSRKLTSSRLLCFFGLSCVCLIATGCISGPPSTVRIQPGRAFGSEQGHIRATSGLRVATYNVWGLPSWINGASGSRYSRIACGLDELESDVVLLQEVWTCRSFVELSEQKRGLERTWWTASARRKGGFLGQNGLLTLSRFPITGTEIRHFKKTHLPDCMMRKGALKVTVTTSGGQRFNIWNVHLQDGDGVRQRVRVEQTAELIRWINEAGDAQTADIVGGDFNFTPESNEFRQFVAAVGPSIHQLAGCPAFATWDGLKPGAGQTLDHIFIRLKQPEDKMWGWSRRIFATSRSEDRLSDHMGVEAFLTFGGNLENPTDRLVQRASPSKLLESTAMAPQ